MQLNKETIKKHIFD